MERQRMELERATSALEDARKQVEASLTKDEVGLSSWQGHLGGVLLLLRVGSPCAHHVSRVCLRARRVADVRGRGSFP